MPAPPSPAVWRETLLAIAAVSALPLVGLAALAWHGPAVRRAAPLLVCFAAGALLGAVGQLLPEAYAHAPAPALVPALVGVGALTFFALERLLHDAHGHHDRAHAAPGCTAHPAGGLPGALSAPSAHGAHGAHGAHATGAAVRRPLVLLNLAGDGLHNLLDGMLIAATFLAGPSAGVMATLAVTLHEVPRELGTFGAYVHAGLSARRALAYNAVGGVLATVGAAVTLAVGERAAGFAGAVLPFAAGNFLYVGTSLVLPALRAADASADAGVGGSRGLRGALVALGAAAAGAPALLR